ncbi:GNAT family N-acetyltransferase [uncultured Hyphomonas sp.]|uniref:GNAT family N-acetyltransferase n=1 Tax=uncultured Hyphomonas sp. TaxID=225298 RepID=UPI002AAAF085|nr:GNAT family N-acetyltransferase [uncultured Hyphomonas sp.]
MTELTTFGSLVLREPTMDDLKRHFEIFGDAEAAVHASSGPVADKDDSRRKLQTIKDHWWRYGFGHWAVSTVDDPEFVIGFGGLAYRQINVEERFNLRFRLAREAWGKGYAHELGLASFHMAFQQLEAEAVHAIVRPENAKVIEALEQLHMSLSETVKDLPDLPPSLVYAITAAEARAAGY